MRGIVQLCPSSHRNVNKRTYFVATSLPTAPASSTQCLQPECDYSNYLYSVVVHCVYADSYPSTFILPVLSRMSRIHLVQFIPTYVSGAVIRSWLIFLLNVSLRDYSLPRCTEQLWSDRLFGSLFVFFLSFYWPLCLTSMNVSKLPVHVGTLLPCISRYECKLEISVKYSYIVICFAFLLRSRYCLSIPSCGNRSLASDWNGD